MQKYSISEFKRINGIKNEKRLYSFLHRLGFSQLLLRKVNIKTLAKYMTEDRNVIFTELEDRKIIYITTGKKSNNACQLVINSNYFEFACINYNRVGNGINEDGMATVTKYVNLNDKLQNLSYGIKLSILNSQDYATLTYFGDLFNKNNASFSIKVNPYTLDGYGSEARITETLNANNVLDIFRVAHLQGNNIINNQLVNYFDEDLSFLEKTQGFQKSLNLK